MRRLWWGAVVSLIAALVYSVAQPAQDVSALYNKSQIDAMLIGGSATAVAWDSSCYWQMRANRNAGQDPRTAINNGGSYAAHTWVSVGGRGSQLEIEVPKGTASIPLQLNAVTFVCSSLVSPDGAGADYGSGDARIVSNSNAPNDRRPNAMGGGTNQPAFAGSRFRVDSASATPSGSVNLAGGTVLSYLRDNNSRYWFASPRGFTYTKSGGFTETTNVVVTVRGRHVSQFYDWAWHCTPGPPNFIGGWNYGQCNQAVMSFNIRVNVRDYNLVPQITSLPTSAEAGQSVTATGSVTKTGTTATSDPTDVRYTRIIYKQGQSAPSNMSGGTSTSAGSCEYHGMTGTNASRCTSVTPSIAHGGVNGRTTFTGSGKSIPSVSSRLPEDFDVGDRVCYGLSVRGYNHTTGRDRNGARHSALRCVVIGKKPKVHITGGDVLVRGTASTPSNVTTSTTTVGGVEVPATEAELDEQVENTKRHWYFGKGAHLYFSDTGVSVQPRTTPVAGNEGTTVAVNGKGQVQFYTDGMNIYRANGATMDNGTGLNGTATTTQAAAAFPISNNRYVVVVSTARTEDSVVGELRYSIVDMTLNSGAGRVSVKNQPFGSRSGTYRVGEALSVTPNAQNTGYWVVSNTPGTNTIRSYLVPYDWSGTNGTAITPVNSSNGLHSGQGSGVGAPGFGTINFNEQATEMVISMRNGWGETGTVRVHTFNSTTGRFTERVSWNTSGGSMYSGDFSPSGRYVYVTQLYTAGGAGWLQRYDVRAGATRTSVLNSLHNIAVGSTGMAACGGVYGGGGQVKRAPDGKMYVARHGCQYIGVVNNPDAGNSGIGWQPSGRSLPSGVTSVFGLPQVAAVLRVNMNPPEYQSMRYGSWSEYATAASGQVTGLSTASGYAGGVVVNAASSSYCNLSLLTFSNRNNADTCLATEMGRYTLPPVISTVVDRYASRSSSPIGSSVRVGGSNGLTTGVYRPTVSGTVTINRGNGDINAGESIVIYAPNNDILINGNLTYTSGTLTGIARIPQLVIIGRNITVHNSVSTVDAWLVTKTTGQGNLYTCEVAFASLTTSRCSSRLTVNGPVIVNKLHLRRTAGAEAGPDRAHMPAEVFNLRPDAYLWGIAQNSGTGRIPTVMTTELPPRF